jgi:hypothetical protein
MKKIILLSTFIILGVLALSNSVYAASATFSVLPSTATNNVGTAFNVSASLDPQGNKICVVEGALSFNNLTCQSIAVQSGIMTQAAPTCASPSFTLGIPKCAITDQNLLSVSVKGNNAGTASVTLTGIKVIGAGADVAFTSQAGLYNIVQVAPASSSSSSSSSASSQASAPKTATPKTTVKTTSPTVQSASSQSSGSSSQPAVETTAPAEAAAASSTTTADFFRSPIVIIAIIIIAFFILFWAYNKFFKKDKTQVK